MSFTYSLTSEGTMDRMLLPLLDWLIGQHATVPFNGRWADPSVFQNRSKAVAARISETVRHYPCNILFVHRDSDGAGFDERAGEIKDCLVEDIAGTASVVCTVPVRMTEAWFLFDETAIRKAADNPNGTVALRLPNAQQVQRLADPKERLGRALIEASEASGRRRKDFERRLAEKKHLVAQHISDFSALRTHQAFQHLEDDVVAVLTQNGWM